ncbi:hypothetical protein MASR2M117_01760 [Paludibacter sp.]
MSLFRERIKHSKNIVFRDAVLKYLDKHSSHAENLIPKSTFKNHLSKNAFKIKRMAPEPQGIFKYGMDSIITYTKNWNDEWQAESRQQFTFDNQSRLIYHSSAMYNLEFSTYEDQFRQSVQYNDAGLVTMELVQNWNESANAWQNEEKKIYTYTPDGKLVSNESYNDVFDEVTSELNSIGDSKTETLYDDKGEIIGYITYLWNNDTQKWIAWSKNISIND